MNISVGIVTRNRRKSLKDTLESITRQTKNPFEVIVVENNLVKTLDSLLGSFSSNLKIKYFLVKPIGIAKCRNRVLEKAEGALTAFVDDDCILPNDWCAKAVRNFSKGSTVLVVGKSLNLYIHNPVSRLEEDIYFTWMSQYINPDNKKTLPSGMFVNTRNLVFRTRFLKLSKVKFSPNAPHKIEDTDFGIRFFEYTKKHHRKMIYDPNLVVYHKNSTNLPEFLKRKTLSNKGEKWLLDKYPEFKNIKMRDEKSYEKLMKRNILARLLFSSEGFITRQRARLFYFWKNKKLP